MSTVKTKKLSAGKLEAVARLFGALSEPGRLAILQALHDGPLSVNELVEAMGMKQANVSKHLGVLHDHHLVRRQREGVFVRYEIADPVIFKLCDLVCGKMEKDVRRAAALFGS
jgi:DNA-binding transcriptional ArsR family regulator